MRVDADAVILHGKAPEGAARGSGKVDTRAILVSVLQSITNEILKDLLKMRRADVHFGQRVEGDIRFAFAHRLCEG